MDWPEAARFEKASDALVARLPAAMTKRERSGWCVICDEFRILFTTKIKSDD